MSSAFGYMEDSVALAVFASDDVDLAVGWGSGADTDPSGAVQAAVAQALARTTQEPKVCIVLTEANSGQRVAEALRAELPPGTLIIGGAAGRLEMGGTTHQFCGTEIADTGVAILLLAGPVVFSSAVGTGWRTLGASGTVTRSTYGSIHEIDGRPATDWVSGYLDLSPGRSTFGNPLAVRDPGIDEWYLRVVVAGDAAGSLSIPGAIPEGATVQLTTTNPDDMLAATSDALQRARAAFPATATPTAALVFSCAVRKYLLGTRTGEEVEAARSLLPDAIADSRHVLHRRDRSYRREHRQPLPQRDVRDVVARHVTDQAARENLRLARRIKRLEGTLEQVEQIRDGNAQLLNRLMDDLEAERRRSHELLLNVLPAPIVARLDAGETNIADRHEYVAVVMTDLVAFTPSAAQLSAAELVAELNDLFSRFDDACAARGVEKIKTIGDAYMAVAGLDHPMMKPTAATRSAAAANLALDMIDALDAAGSRWQMRIGIHAGPVVAGVIGTRKFAYDVWGDTVNVASRLETTSLPNRIQVSADRCEAAARRLHALRRVAWSTSRARAKWPTWFVVGRL